MGAKYSKTEVLAFKKIFEGADRDGSKSVSPGEVSSSSFAVVKSKGLGATCL